MKTKRPHNHAVAVHSKSRRRAKPTRQALRRSKMPSITAFSRTWVCKLPGWAHVSHTSTPQSQLVCRTRLPRAGNGARAGARAAAPAVREDALTYSAAQSRNRARGSAIAVPEASPATRCKVICKHCTSRVRSVQASLCPGIPMSSPEISRAASTVQTSPAIDSSLASDAVLQLDELYQEQLRGAAAEIAAAVAHAVGTPLNVISGRAELIRQDPANALAQVTRIEEQVRKLADGLRDFVEYLTTDVRSNRNLPATRVMAQACALLRPVAQQHQVELLVDDTLLLPGAAAAGTATPGAGTAAGGAAELEVDQRSVSNLVTLLSWAIRCTAATRAPDQRRLRLVGSA